MRILIVGAGISGLTLAALLHQRGIQPDLIDQRDAPLDQGYMLGISPLGSRVLYGLGLMDTFLSQSVASDSYMMCNGSGEVIHQFSLRQVYETYGPNRACTRGTLLRVLMKACDGLSIRTGLSVSAIEQKGEVVQVTFTDGSLGEYDLVVGADGIHSEVRHLILTPDEYSYFESKWGGWLWWTTDPRLQAGTATEFWGSGYMLGLYPTESQFGAFAILPAEKDKTTPYPGLRSHIRQSMSDLIARFPQVFEQIPEDRRSNMSYWPLTDVRASVWFKKNVVLLGDAATGFLPTSGVGAAMAMESAAVLADELGRTDRYHLGWALSLYQKRRQARVEHEQDDARDLAKGLFVRSALQSHLRNMALQRYSTKSFAEGIAKVFDSPI